MHERRKSIRLRMDFWIMFYRIKENDKISRKALGINISINGMLMKADDRLEEGEELRLEILPQGVKKPVTLYGRVAHALDNLWEEEPHYRFGIEFINLSPEMKKDIERFVEDRLKQQNWTEWF